MLKGLRALFAFVFLTNSLTASFWVVCDAPGPDGHKMVEFLLSPGDCGERHDAHPASEAGPESGTVATGCCGDCVDEPLQFPDVTTAAQACPVLPCVLPPTIVALVSAGTTPSRAWIIPNHPGDPPLFLTYCNFRI